MPECQAWRAKVQSHTEAHRLQGGIDDRRAQPGGPEENHPGGNDTPGQARR